MTVPSTRYLLDGNQTLTATASGQTTYYLSGVGEYRAEWSYYLVDGTGSVRQTTDGQGQVTGTRSFTPWGEVLEQSGQVDLTTGYLGGMLDAVTGLIYVGSGQYYDPATGRFLTRSVNPTQPNPYVPWSSDPAGAMLAPLALLTMVYGKKKKRGKWDNLVIVVMLCLTVGIGLAGCDNSTQTPGPVDATVTVAPTATPTSTPMATVTLMMNDTPIATATVPVSTSTLTPTPQVCTFKLTPIEPQNRPANVDNEIWNTYVALYKRTKATPIENIDSIKGIIVNAPLDFLDLLFGFELDGAAKNGYSDILPKLAIGNFCFWTEPTHFVKGENSYWPITEEIDWFQTKLTDDAAIFTYI